MKSFSTLLETVKLDEGYALGDWAMFWEGAEYHGCSTNMHIHLVWPSIEDAEASFGMRERMVRTRVRYFDKTTDDMLQFLDERLQKVAGKGRPLDRYFPWPEVRHWQNLSGLLKSFKG